MVIELDASQEASVEESRAAEQASAGEWDELLGGEAAQEQSAEQADTAETKPPQRTITIPMPATCEIEVAILVEHGDDGLWRSGFAVIRRYCPGAHPQQTHETDPAEEDGHERLGEAIAWAIEQAVEWIDESRMGLEPQSIEAAEALDKWLAEFDRASATESMFDMEVTPDEYAEACAAAGVPVANSQPSIQPSLQETMKAIYDAGGKAWDNVNTAPADPAEREYQAKIAEVQATIANAAVVMAQKKAEFKKAKSIHDTAVSELSDLMESGPERLPLLDRPAAHAAEAAVEATAAKAAKAVESAESAEGVDGVAPEDQAAALPPEAKSTVTIHLLANIEAEGINFGANGTVMEAFLSDTDDVFLAYYHTGEWKYAYLDTHEWEEVDVQKSIDVLTPAPAEQEDDGQWRFAPIEQLAPSLPPSLIEKLRENNVGTIGGLEDLRAEIAQGRAKWPKGIGEAKVTKIENAVLDWLTKNRDAKVFAEVK